MRVLILGLFAIALLLGGVVGTGTRMLFQWPAYFVLGLAGVASVVKWGDRPRVWPQEVCLLAAGVFIVYGVGRALTSPVGYLARADLFLIVACGLVYWMTAVHFTRSRDRLVIFWVLVALMVGNLALSLVHLGGNAEFMILPGYARKYEAGRVGGFFDNPNHLGAFLAFTGMLALGQAVFGRGGSTIKTGLFFLTGLAVLGLVLTASRGAVLGLVCGVTVFVAICGYVLRKRHEQIFGKVVVAGGLAIGFVAAGFVALSLTFLRKRMGGEGILQETAREHFWRAALDQFASSPLVGTGSRTYYYLSRYYRPQDLFTAVGEIEFAHNEYLQALADYGLAGVVLLLAAVVVHFGNGVRYLGWVGRGLATGSRGIPSVRLGLTVGVMAGLAVLLVHAVFDFHFHVPAVALMAAFGFGVLANPGLEGRGSLLRVPIVRYGLSAATVFTAGWMVYCGIGYGRGEYYLERGRRLPKEEMSFENIALFERAKQFDSKNPNIYVASGDAWMERARGGISEAGTKAFLEKAVGEYERAYALYPYDIYLVVSYAYALDGVGRTEEAGVKNLEAMELAPCFQHPRLAYAMHLHRVGEYDEAAEVYRSCYEGHALQDIDGSMGRVRDLEKLLAEDRRRMRMEEGAQNPGRP